VTDVAPDVWKQMLVAYLADGSSVVGALAKVGRSRKSYEAWRKKDPLWAAACDEAKLVAKRKQAEVLGTPLAAPPGSFEEFSRKYVGSRLFPHQVNMVDVVEGREPSHLHSSMIYEAGAMANRRVLINLPPNHAKALALDTRVPTPHGWSDIKSLRVGDQVFGLDGKPTTVIAKSEVFHKPTSTVSMSSGESFVASDDHLWAVMDSCRGQVRVVSTRELKPGDYLPSHSELHVEEFDPILDPYLLGVWLGDGHTSCGDITSADQEIFESFTAAGFEVASDKYKASHTTQTRCVIGLYRVLSELGIRGAKRIPEAYLFGSYEQRLALLQGLMDTDGTISVSGQAAFTNTNKNLAEGVHYLASSLGLRPRIKEGRATLQDRDCGPKWTITFTPSGLPIFRLERKLRRVVPVGDGTQGGPRLRRVESIGPAEQVPTQCITVDNDSHIFLIGTSLIPTHNTMTLSVNYVTYRICTNPNINILLISKTQEFAKKIMYGVKQRLTHPRYEALQLKYGPADGFKASADLWTANKIYLGAESRDSTSKDPTLEAIGVGGQVYGARADLILLDDVVTLSNAGAYEGQSDWIRQEVASRLGPGGQIIVVGTRVASVDLYRHLRDPDHYTDGVVPWTYLAMPAVLQYGAGEKEWETLWPASDEPFVETDEEITPGIWPRWTGPRLAQVRNEVGPRKWSLVYQQADVAEDSTFDAVCVRGSVNPNRNHGPLEDLSGWHVVMGVDPAISGQMALAVVAGNRETGEFKVLTVETLINPTPAMIKDLIIETARKYTPHEVLIEDNAFQGFLAQDEALNVGLANLGVVVRSHHTGANKTDPDFGVASLAALFGTRHNPGPGAPARHQKDNMLELPNSGYGPVKVLIEELVAWNPEVPVKRRRQDCVMALWFAVKRLREFGVGAPVNRKQASFAAGSKFTSARSKQRQMVVSLVDWERRGA
jgi:hypothetical protein